MSSLIYEVQAGTGPSGKQREVGAEENVRAEDVAAQIPSLPTKDWLGKEGRSIHHRGRSEARGTGEPGLPRGVGESPESLQLGYYEARSEERA